MRRRLDRDRGLEAAAAALAAALVLAIGIAALPPFGRDEGRFAQASREMLDRGDLVVPTFAGRMRPDKPILVYWAIMASTALFGVSAWAARLPSLLAAAATVALVAWAARGRAGPGSGLLAGALLLASPAFFLQGKACTADMVMLLPTTAAMLALGRLWSGEGGGADRVVLWAGLGLAVLAKGPVAPAVVAGTALAGWALWRRWRRWEVAAAAALALAGWLALGPLALVPALAAAAAEGWRDAGIRGRLRGLGSGWGLPLAAGIVLPWAAAAWWRTDGAFFAAAVGRHVVDRSLTALESHGGFPGFYLATGPLAAFPWFAVALAATIATARGGGTGRDRFAVAWLLGTAAVLELTATRMVHYLLPAYPAGAMLAAAWSQRGPVRARWPAAVLLAGGLALAAAVPVAVTRLELGGVLGPAALAGAVLAAATACAALLLRNRPASALAAAALGGVVGMVVVTAVVLPRVAPRTVASRLAEAALDARRAGEPLLLLHPRDDEVFFLLPLDAEAVRSAGALAARLEEGGPALVAARTGDLERVARELPGLRMEVVSEVRGVDPGRGEWATAAIARIGGGPP